MYKKPLSFLTLLLLTAVFASCTADEEDLVVIQGEITDRNSGNPIENVTVQITAPQQFNDIFTRTDELGQYSLEAAEISEVTDLTLTASVTDYVDVSRTIKVAPGDNITGFNFELAEEGSDDSDTDDEVDDEVSGESMGAARLQLVNVAEESINVRGTGGIENSTFTFVVLDSAGRAINSQNAVEVQFNIIKGPNGGEVLLPDRVETNAQGRVVCNLASGDSSGVVRIEALIEREDVGLTIRSNPVLIAIHNGFTSSGRFFIAPENYNVEGFGILPGQGSETFDYTVTASLADRYGNPVVAGTSVDFRTEFGGVIEGSSLTDDNGRATVLLRPDGSTPTESPSGIGFFKVIGKTIDENNDYVTRELEMLFTTDDANITISPQSFAIPSNGSETFTYTVTDLNGYPMAAGTQISVEAADGIEVSGDVGFTLGDYLNPGPGRTEFAFTASDIDDQNFDVVGTSLTIRVISASSGTETTRTIQGTRAKW